MQDRADSRYCNRKHRNRKHTQHHPAQQQQGAGQARTDTSHISRNEQPRGQGSKTDDAHARSAAVGPSTSINNNNRPILRTEPGARKRQRATRHHRTRPAEHIRRGAHRGRAERASARDARSARRAGRDGRGHVDPHSIAASPRCPLRRSAASPSSSSSCSPPPPRRRSAAPSSRRPRRGSTRKSPRRWASRSSCPTSRSCSGG